jgi:predicted dehydrogenase
VKPVRIGVAGVGSMGMNHCRILPMLKGTEFVGIYDTNCEKVNLLAKKYNVIPFQSYKEMLLNVNAVILAVPTPIHYSYTKEAIKEGKHVLVEKPFVTTQDDATHIIELMKNKQITVQVGHVEQFNPAFQQLTKVIDETQIISIEARRMGVSQRNLDIDVILDVMIHDIDIALKIANSRLDQISAIGVSLNKEKNIDIAHALLSFQNGIIANLVASRISQKKCRLLEITEKKRFIKLDYLSRELFVNRETDIPLKDQGYQQDSLVEKIYVPIIDPLQAQLEDFIKCIQIKQCPRVGAIEAANALEIALKIKERINS